MTTIDLAELRRITAAALDHLEETRGARFDVGPEYFWSIPLDETFDRYDAPNGLTLGQVSEALSFLRSSVESGSPTAHDLRWLGQVFDAIAADGELPEADQSAR